MSWNSKFNELDEHRIPYTLQDVMDNNGHSWTNMTKEHIYYLHYIAKLKKYDHIELNESNYLKYLEIALFLEELKKGSDYLYNETISVCDNIMVPFKFRATQFITEREQNLENLRAKVTDVKTGQSYVFIIKEISEECVFAIPHDQNKRFYMDYDANNLYDIQFKLNPFTFRCCHYALSMMRSFKLVRYFFPTKNQCASNETNENFKWYNESVQNNPEQRQAVTNILNGTSGELPYILFGPPGTGKTATLVEAICQSRHNNSCEHILICTPSNEACDVIMKQLLKYVPKEDLHRMYSFQIDPRTIDREIMSCCNYINGEFVVLSAIDFPKIVITTLCASVRLQFLKLKDGFFNFLYIDEAGQATEPETLIPISLLASISSNGKKQVRGQIVLAGDPHQLGPVIYSNIAEKVLGTSMLERLSRSWPYKKDKSNRYDEKYITKLLRNYRSHPSLVCVPNKLFYDDELIPCASNDVYSAEGWTELPNPKIPMILMEVRGEEIRNVSLSSSYNKAEMYIVLDYVQKLIGMQFGKKKIEQNDIGIVTPFAAQKWKLKAMLSHNKFDKIDVGTVELFQGKEKEIIILSTVRSQIFVNDGQSHIGLLSSSKRFNVAITRAKSLLIVIGHPSVFQANESWKYLANYCRENGTYCVDTYTLKNRSKKRKQEHYCIDISSDFVLD